MSETAPHRFTVINNPANTVDNNWNGTPTTLLTNQNVGMPQTPNGSTILSAMNQSALNNEGQLSLTSGGGAPTFLTVPANANQPTVLTNNWKANNLSLTNISLNNNTPILAQAVGPGIPGVVPLALTVNTSLQLGFGQVAQGNALPQYVQLVLQSTAATLGIIGVIGGPVDGTGNNAYVIAINATANTGPGTGNTPPVGYYATTTSNTYPFQFNWGSSLVFVANLSPSTAQAVNVRLRPL